MITAWFEMFFGVALGDAILISICVTTILMGTFFGVAIAQKINDKWF